MNKVLLTLKSLGVMSLPFISILFGKLMYLFVTNIFVNMSSGDAGFLSTTMTLLVAVLVALFVYRI